MNYQVIRDQAPLNGQVCRLQLLDYEGQPIGYAIGEFRQHAMWYNGQRYFFLQELVITQPFHRQQGLGNQLLKEVETFAREQGAYWIRGQLGAKPIEYTPTQTDERALKAFWGNNGYGIKREIYDGSIRFWKPLQTLTGHFPINPR